MKSTSQKKPVGVIGAGSFGTAIARLLSLNTEVLLFVRSASQAAAINDQKMHRGFELASTVTATSSAADLAAQCDLIFPIVPSAHFSEAMRLFAPYLKPYHILIHGTKGLDISDVREDAWSSTEISASNILTMSEVIENETSVVRIGCLSGPNLASEINAGQPTATVIASNFDEVIAMGQAVLNSEQFFVFGSHEIKGAELAGAFKNIIALGSGMLSGLGLGKNIQAMLITRGLREMIYFGKAVGVNSRAFLGTAGIGDLIATATSEKSRNFTFGYRLAKGETVEEIIERTDEIAEGVRTLKIADALAKYYKVQAPITQIIYRTVYQEFDMRKAINYLMRYPFAPDVDFL